ncbi:MAG: nitroreductase family protein [Hydrogenophaga sp.]|uniref:nitroreductase family protein n=1 Tax=Hydrogenophaga intermedia TaxID=65786 RepID=UPI0020447573|nr:nitroreductase family protein [Hydrogenophaga intermedia]MCM3566209.1 nitroreductase family protein [Hydrogenophaga intermedia]
MSTVQLNLQTDDVLLPPANTGGGETLANALRRRRSTRDFLPDALDLQAVSDLLWAAFGVNRAQGHGRTAPSAHDWQEIAVYVVLPEGAFRYEARDHRLALVKAEDLRAHTGLQSFAATAPLNLVYVADFAAMHDTRPDERPFLAGADAACIAQNVYLHCAAHGLGTVVRALIDRRQLAQSLGLKPTERIALAQSVGLPVLPLA